jgi:SulP family sulfate permease
LFFGSTSDFQQLYKQIPDSATKVILRLGKMEYLDQSGLYAIEDMIQDLQTKGVEVLFVNVLRQPRYMMERIDIIPGFIPEKQIFSDFKSCIESLIERHAK